MKKQEYAPEGKSIKKELYTESELIQAMESGAILEARCIMCDKNRDLQVKLSGIKGIIPRDEAAIGIKDGSVGDVAVITRVNKSVCFKVLSIENGVAILSREAAQRECLEYILTELKAGDVIDARITHLEQFGAFCDIGCGIISMIPIDGISVSRIDHPASRFVAGDDVKVVIKDIDRSTGRISVSHKELLGTWQQNADMFSPGQTVPGIVRSIESYGIFIELTPNLAGLSELMPGFAPGERVSVYIKSIIPEKMKVKLAVVDKVKEDIGHEPFEYIFVGDHMDIWQYSPDVCHKKVISEF